jgi:hypothetical protein
MDPELNCWKCGAPLEDEPLPLSRTAACRRCGAELHVCRFCEYYDVAYARSCREPVADPPSDKLRANFCGYFRARPGAFAPAAGGEAPAALDALFGAQGSDPATDRPAGDPAEQARRALDDLFGGKDR